MVVERMLPTSTSFENTGQLQRRQQGTQAQASSTIAQAQVQPPPPPLRQHVEFSKSNEPSRRPQMTNTTTITQPAPVPPAPLIVQEESQLLGDEQHRRAVRQTSSSSLRRSVLVRQDADSTPPVTANTPTTTSNDLATAIGNESSAEMPAAAAHSRSSATTTATTTNRQSSRPPPLPSQQQPVELPPYPSPRAHHARGQTPVVELFEEPDDLFFIVKELVLTERTYLRDLELAAVRLPAVLASYSPRHHGHGHDSTAMSDSELSISETSSSAAAQQRAGSSSATSGLGCLCSFASSTLHPLLNFHRAFAAELESRLCAWTASCSAVNECAQMSPQSARQQTALLQIGDILMSLTSVLHLYRSYLARLLGLLWSPLVGSDLALLTEALGASNLVAPTNLDPNLAAFYISPALLLCRPAHRLLAYRHLLATYVGHLSPTHPDSLDASALLARLSDLLAGNSSVLGRVDSARVLLELRGSLSGQQQQDAGASGPAMTTDVPSTAIASSNNLTIPLAACTDFVRLGCLHKLTRKGYQPRLFVLLSDSLLYAARFAPLVANSSSSASANSPVFRLHSLISLRDLSLVGAGGSAGGSAETEPGRIQLVETTTGRRLQLIATSLGDWRRWVADLRVAIAMASAGTSAANTSSLPRRRYMAPPGGSSTLTQQQQQILSCSVESGGSLSAVSPPLLTASEASSMSPDVHLSTGSPRSNAPFASEQQQQSSQQQGGSCCGGVSIAHVCWHRALSLGVDDVRLAGSGAQLSSYLLRKFKSAPGWQKLWVVLAADCALHFFKSCYDPAPLASLPLLGYSISSSVPSGTCLRSESPSASQQQQQHLVFKLQFKSHVYLFRAESRYTYSRWLEAIRMATLAWWTAEQSSEAEGADETGAFGLQQDDDQDAMYVDDYMPDEDEQA